MLKYRHVFNGDFYRNKLVNGTLCDDHDYYNFQIDVQIPIDFATESEAVDCCCSLRFEVEDNHVVLKVYFDKNNQWHKCVAGDVIDTIHWDEHWKYKTSRSRTLAKDMSLCIDACSDYVPDATPWDELFDIQNQPHGWRCTVEPLAYSIDIIDVETHQQDNDFSARVVAAIDSWIIRSLPPVLQQRTLVDWTLIGNYKNIVLEQIPYEQRTSISDDQLASLVDKVMKENRNAVEYPEFCINKEVSVMKKYRIVNVRIKEPEPGECDKSARLRERLKDRFRKEMQELGPILLTVGLPTLISMAFGVIINIVNIVFRFLHIIF